MKKQLAILLLVILAIILLSGCATTQYILTGQYTNPNTEDIENVNIYVSQHEYDNMDVGAKLQVKIHTVMLGIRVPITQHTNTGNLGMIDLLPLIVMAVPFYFLVTSIFKPHSKDRSKYIIGSLILCVLSVLIASTTAPDFNAIATIIDKTSGVY